MQMCLNHHAFINLEINQETNLAYHYQTYQLNQLGHKHLVRLVIADLLEYS